MLNVKVIRLQDNKEITTLHMQVDELPRHKDFLNIRVSEDQSSGVVVHHVIREYESGYLIGAEIVVE